MGVWRAYNHEENMELLKSLTDGLARCQTYAEQIYIGKLSEELRVRAELSYANYDIEPAVGIDIKIISLKSGEIDSYHFDFDRFWGGDSGNHQYWLTKKSGWFKKQPTTIQLLALNSEISNIVDMYKEEYF